HVVGEPVVVAVVGGRLLLGGLPVQHGGRAGGGARVVAVRVHPGRIGGGGHEGSLGRGRDGSRVTARGGGRRGAGRANRGMRPLADALARVPAEVRRAGGSLPLRGAVLALAVLAHIGFSPPSIPDAAPGAGVPGTDKLVHVGVLALTVWAAG